MLIVRFRAYAPNGEPLGILPHPLSWEAGLPFNDMSSLTMTYPDGSDAADLLKQPCEVALELRNPRTGTFTEHPGCRFLNIKRSVNLAARPRVLSFTMPSYGWQLRKVRFMSRDNPRMNKENRIVYKTDVGPGLVLRELLNEAKNRGNVPGLTYTFTGSVDSAGQGWDLKISGEFDLGQDAWSIADSFARQGLIDWWFNKREFEIFKPNTYLRRQLDTDTGVNIHSLLAVSEEPVDRTWEENAGHLLIIGDTRATRLLEAGGTADLPWGKWDEAFSASGITNGSFMLDIGQHMMATKYRSRTQFTKRLVWTEGAPVPLVDYRQGDFIRARDDTGSQKAGMRVHQITLSGVDPYGVSIALTLNDRFMDRNLQTERWMNRVTGGGGPVGGGGTGAGISKPPPPAQDSSPPKAPREVQVANAPYFSELGDPVATADVSFEVVLEDILGNDIDVAHYNVAAVRDDHVFEQARVVQVPQPASPSTGQRVHGLVPLLDSGHTYHFYVQAIRESGYASEWTEPVSQEMGYPIEAPEAPSAPQLSSKLSTVKAEWDGHDRDGHPYPASLREIQVEASTDDVTWFHVGDIFSPGSSVILSGKGGSPTWNVGDTVYVRFRARNSASVISDPSETASVAVVGVGGPDIAAGAITADHVAAGSLTAEQIKAHSLSVDRLAVGNPANLIVDPALTSPELNANRLAMARSSSGTINTWEVVDGRAVFTHNYTTGINNYARFVLSNNTLLDFPVQTFPGPVLPTPELVIPVSRPIGANGTAGNLHARFQVDASGFPADMGAAVVKVSLSIRQFTRDGISTPVPARIISEFTITANGSHTLQSTTGAAIPEDVVGVLPYLYIASEGGVPPGIQLAFSTFEMWQESSVFIGPGTISSPHISANAITAEKLAVDAITAKHSIHSAYYEMRSEGPGATVKVTSNANFAGQSGIQWDGLQPAGGHGPRIFQSDPSGSGGWDPRGFVIVGPEQVTNSSGRVDLEFNYGVTNSSIARIYGSETVSRQGIFWDTSVARFRIGGMFNTGHHTNDMLRFGKVTVQNGWIGWGIVTSRRYYPMLTPNAGSTPVTSSINLFQDQSGNSGAQYGFTYVSSPGTDEVYYLAACGTP